MVERRDRMQSLKVLIIDSDPASSELLRICLEKEGYGVISSPDGEDGLAKFFTVKPDIVLLDAVLQRVDGWQVCREIRKKSQTPLIFVTSKTEVFDRVLGLERGADDYIVKPFDGKEVIARIKAVCRRIGLSQRDEELKEVHYDCLDIDMSKYELRVRGKVLDTPPKELELLFHLASHPNTVFNRDQLLDSIWGFEYYGGSRTIDVHIKRLRDKLDGVSKEWSLETVWSVGYKFELAENAGKENK